MVFQDPMSALNPMKRIGPQICAQTVRLRGLSKFEGRKLALDLLRRTGIPDPEDRYRRYPHEMSGGMLQRAMIALALAGTPRMLIADEPTTALDATVQAQILELIRDIRRTEGLAVVLITHDIGVVASVADRVVVLYAGRVAETGKVDDVLLAPVHPYTRGLLAAVPDVRSRRSNLSRGHSGHRHPTRPDSASAARLRRAARRESIPAGRRRRVSRRSERTRRITSPRATSPIRRVMNSEDVRLRDRRPGPQGPLCIRTAKSSRCGRSTDSASRCGPANRTPWSGSPGAERRRWHARSSGLQRATSGEVRIHGRDLSEWMNDRKALAREVQFVFQNPLGALSRRQTVRNSRSKSRFSSTGSETARCEGSGSAIWSTWSACRHRSSIGCRDPFRAASARGWPSLAPSRSTRRFSSATSRSAHSTFPSRPRSSRCSFNCSAPSG